MAELQRKKQKSVGTICKDAIMTGISYMIPVIVGGGVITAIAKMMGGYNIGDTAAEMQTLAQVIFTIGNNLFAFAVPCLAAFIAYAIADKPGIAPGYAMGVLAGLMKTGFVGGLVGALIAGWFVLQMKKIKVPKALQGIIDCWVVDVVCYWCSDCMVDGNCYRMADSFKCWFKIRTWCSYWCNDRI